MKALFYYIISSLYLLSSVNSKNINGEDGILHNINWPGTTCAENMKKWGLPGTIYSEENSIIMTAHNNDRYRCMLPDVIISDHVINTGEATISAAELLSPLLVKQTCAYRLESYWTYELCHGKHIRQFHEEKAPGGKVKLQEYYLGYFEETKGENDIFTSLIPEKIPQEPQDVESKIIDGVRTPYFSFMMEHGTGCGLKQGAKRKTKVLYICHEQSRNEIMSVTETSSCEYELTVLTPILCKNPLYTIDESPINEMYCIPLDNSPDRPYFEEQTKPEFEKQAQIVPVHPEIDEDEIRITEPLDNKLKTVSPTIAAESDKALIKSFLNGEFCLFGGTGWWKYEFCYGRHVKQYHDDKVLGRTTIVVGQWNEDDHLNWIKTTKPIIYTTDIDPLTKLPLKTVKIVQQFYSNGDLCDEAGKKREVVVKLKCMQSRGSSHSVSIYLLEPKTCSYILGVESPILCDLLDTADENGMLVLN